MPLDPADERWLKDRFESIDRDKRILVDTANEAAGKLTALNMRLRVVENREKVWRGACLSLSVLLLGSIFTSVYRGGTVDATQAAQGRQIEAHGAALKEVEARLRDLERRASPK